jgi:diguanylate cyclase
LGIHSLMACRWCTGFRAAWLRCVCVLPVLLALLAGPAAAQSPLILSERAERLWAWPALTVMAEPAGTSWTLPQALAQQARLAAPSTAPGTLGVQPTATWLRLPLQVKGPLPEPWLLDIDYASLTQIDAYLLDEGGQVVSQARMGSSLPMAERPLQVRTPAWTLPLQADRSYTLWLRVQARGPQVLPVYFTPLHGYFPHALAEQSLQAALAGLALCLVVYSLLQWVSLRDALYLKYAALAGGSAMFSFAQFGLGVQLLWPGSGWIEAHAAASSALLASGATFAFVHHVLKDIQPERWFRWSMWAGMALLFGTLAAFLVDLVNARFALAIVGTVGLLPSVLGLPGTLRLMRRGDPVGITLLVAWVSYFVASATMVGMLRGQLPAHFWTLHAFQFGATLDMLLFMRVVALRAKAVRQEAVRLTQERDNLQQLAHTDALTGLRNRRGLEEAVNALLAQRPADRVVALYVIDLDGFKAINDKHGHDAGDALLLAVAQRLRRTMRAGDLVARLGGDEFVVVASGMSHAEQAQHLAQLIHGAFLPPFEVAGEQKTLRAAVGWATAPDDGDQWQTLFSQADGAMYANKAQRGLRLAAATRT